MLVSHDYKFIYVKTHKTASSSIEGYLKPYCKKNGVIDTIKYISHRPAASIKEMVGDQVWESYTKICPVRNPWDKMVSLYYWRIRKRPLYYFFYRIIQGKHPKIPEQRMTFDQLIRVWGKNCNLDRKVMFITDEWEDYFFIRYERLHEDLSALCQQLDIPFDPEQLPNKKAGFRPDKDYRKHYNEETKAIVADAFKEEIEKFGYTF